MKKIIPILLLLISVKSYSCGCKFPDSIEEEFKRHEKVYFVQIKDVFIDSFYVDYSPRIRRRNNMIVEVLEFFKSDSPFSKIDTISTGFGNCSYQAKIGGKHIIYSSKDERYKYHYISICTLNEVYSEEEYFKSHLDGLRNLKLKN